MWYAVHPGIFVSTTYMHEYVFSQHSHLSSSNNSLSSLISFSLPTIISFYGLIAYYATKVQRNILLLVEIWKKMMDFHE